MAYALAEHEYQVYENGAWSASRQINMTLLPDGRHRISGLTGNYATGQVRVRVMAIGNNPPSDWLYSNAAFTGGVASAALALSFTTNANSLAAGGSLNFTATASGGTAPYAHAVTAKNINTNQVTPIGTANTVSYIGTWQNVPAGSYDVVDTVTDAAGAVLPSTPRRVTASAQPPVVTPAGTVNVIFIWGQSNSQTLARRSAIFPGGPFGDVTPSYTREFQRAKVWNYAHNSIEQLQCGSVNYTSTGIGMAGNEMGQQGNEHPASYEDGFSYMIPLAQQFEAQNASGEICFFQSGRGGQASYYFQEGQTGWNNMQQEWNAFKAALAAQGLTLNVLAVLFKQGESDAINGSNSYAQDMAAIANSLRSKIVPANTRIIIDTVMHQPALIAQQQAWVATNPSLNLLIDTNNMTRIEDELHLDAASVLKLGMEDNYNLVFGSNVTYPLAPSQSDTGALFYGKSYQTGNTVSRWKDHSGRQYKDLVQPDANQQFTMATGRNGKACYRSTGNSSFMVPDLQQSYWDFTAVFAIDIPTNSGWTGLLQMGNIYLFTGPTPNGVIYDGNFRAVGSLNTGVGPCIIVYGYSTQANQAYIRLNGLEVWRGTLSPQSLAGNNAGRVGRVDNYVLNGDLYAFLCYQGLLSAEKLTRIEQELSQELSIPFYEPTATDYTPYYFYGHANDAGNTSQTWKNLNPTGAVWQQPDASIRPELISAYNNLKAYRYAGEKWLNFDANLGDLLAFSLTIAIDTSNPGWQIIFSTAGDQVWLFSGNGNGAAYFGGFQGNAPINAGRNVLTWVLQANGASFVRVNGVKTADLGFSQRGFNGPLLGRLSTGNGTAQFQGDIYALALYKGAYSEEEMLRTEGEFMDLLGI